MNYPIYQLPIKLYFEDTDTMGIIYHANYIKYFERARTDWLRSAGFQPMKMEEVGVGFVVRKMEIEWLAPLNLDDEIIATAQVSKMGNASVTLEQTITRGGEMVCRGEVLIVCVGAQSKKPMPVPDELKAVFMTGNV